MFRYVLTILFFIALTPFSAHAEIDDSTLVEKLKQGGYVILVRHAIADTTTRDTDFINLDNCDAQRNLTKAGRNQSISIGKAYKALEIPTGKIFSSKFCRCKDTAKLAFGEPETLLGLSSFMNETSSEKERRVNVIKRLLGTLPPAKSNNILVTHSHMLFRASNIRLVEGHAAVFLPQQDEKFQFVDFIADKRWGRMLESVTEEDDDM